MSYIHTASRAVSYNFCVIGSMPHVLLTHCLTCCVVTLLDHWKCVPCLTYTLPHVLCRIVVVSLEVCPMSYIHTASRAVSSLTPCIIGSLPHVLHTHCLACCVVSYTLWKYDPCLTYIRPHVLCRLLHLVSLEVCPISFIHTASRAVSYNCCII